MSREKLLTRATITQDETGRMDEMESLGEFLKKLAIFEALTEEEMADLLPLCKQYAFKQGAIVAYQGDSANALFIVRQGRLGAFAMDVNGVTTAKRPYLPGQYFDDTWLIGPKVHPATVRAEMDGRLIQLRGEDFLHFLAAHPDAELDLSEAAWAELDRTPVAAPAAEHFGKLELIPGEIVEFESRRSGWLLVGFLVLPILLLIFFPVAAGFMVSALSGGFTSGAVGLALLAGLAPLAWVIFRYLNWANDYLLITNRHIAQREFDLATLRIRTVKIPLDRVQSVSIVKPNLLETLLNIGTLRITTGAQEAPVVFDLVRNPRAAQEALARVRQASSTLESGRSREALRQSLEQYFTVAPPLVEVQDETLAPPLPSQPSRLPRFMRRRPVAPPTNLQTTVTYGRHWLVLVRKTLWVVLLGIVYLFTARYMVLHYPQFQGPSAGIAIVVLFLGIFFLFVYYYQNWANDIFQVTENQVVDIDRGPFNFTESRKTADLLNIQNVEAISPTFWATIFGYGRVVIDTAGASAEIVFEDVTKPAEIQAEIFRRRDRLRQKQQAQDAVARRQEMLLMLDVYQQVTEQDKIPRRTPRPDERTDPLTPSDSA